MKTLEDLQKAIADLNKDFGAAAAEENPIRKVLFKQPKFVNKENKWAKERQVPEHNKNVEYRHIDCGRLHNALRDHLKQLEYNFVIPSFKYQGSIMDMFAMSKEFVVEFEVKTDIRDFGNDFKKLYLLGKIKVNKHSYLEAGKALPNLFYFVAPEGMLTVDDIPGHCGLITAEAITGGLTAGSPAEDITFQIVKTAPLLKPDPAPAAIYRHIATKCYQRYDELLQKRKQGPSTEETLMGHFKSDAE